MSNYELILKDGTSLFSDSSPDYLRGIRDGLRLAPTLLQFSEDEINELKVSERIQR